MKKIILLIVITFLAFSCEEQEANLEESVLLRMVLAETQCANPWEFSRDPHEYKNLIKSYLQEEGVSPVDIQILDELPPNTAICMACTCWSGNNIYISIPTSAVDQAEALGFSKVE